MKATNSVSKAPKKISFFEAIEKSSYSKKTRNILASYLFDEFNNKQTQMFYFNQVEDSATTRIIVMRHIMKIPLGKSSYEVPLLIYIPDSFPHITPEIYIERKTSKLGINKKLSNSFISQKNLRINYEIYNQTTKDVKCIKNALAYLFSIFRKFFPIFSTKSPIVYEGKCILDLSQCWLISINMEMTESIIQDSEDFVSPGEDEVNDLTPTGNVDEGELKKVLIERIVGKVKVSLDNKKQNEISFNDILKNTKDELIERIKNIDMSLSKQKSFYKDIKEMNDEVKEKTKKAESQIKIYNLIRKGSSLSIAERAEALIDIKNKQTLERVEKEEVCEESLALVKKFFTKNLITFEEAKKFTRITSKNLFFFKEGQKMHAGE